MAILDTNDMVNYNNAYINISYSILYLLLHSGMLCLYFIDQQVIITMLLLNFLYFCIISDSFVGYEEGFECMFHLSHCRPVLSI